MTPANPFRTALKLIGIVGLSLAALFLLIGAGASNAAVVGLGGWLAGIGIAGLLLWLVVSSIGWDATIERPARAQTTLSPEDIQALLARKAERG